MQAALHYQWFVVEANWQLNFTELVSFMMVTGSYQHCFTSSYFMRTAPETLGQSSAVGDS
jgi:hypothetical protein